MTVTEQSRQAKQAALQMARLSDAVRSEALLRIADALEANHANILRENREDLAQADAQGLAAPLRKRLSFSKDKLLEVCTGLRATAALRDPLERIQLATELTPGLTLWRVSCPIGVIGVVFESRPDALVQISGLCIRSGNAVLLKGGREAYHTNRALFDTINAAAQQAGLPAGWGALLQTRDDVEAMLGQHESIDLIIPRGSNAFVRHIMDTSRIPVLGHADGICHIYIDRQADIPMAVRVAVDSKTQYVAVCNAVETLLVHADIAPKVLPVLQQALQDKNVTLRGCARTQAYISCDTAEASDWDTEYLDAILSIRIVNSADEAIAHINAHGSGHTDAIITGDPDAADTFMRNVDSAGVYWNCSTRFADGYRYGFGAEVGVATGKLHARGPMGIEGLCTYKYKLVGNGHIVGEPIQYTHRPLDPDVPNFGESE